MRNDLFQTRPFAPAGTRMLSNGSLAEVRDILTNSALNHPIANQIKSMLESWQTDPASVEPYLAMRSVLEQVRKLPHGEERLYAMSTIMKVLGQPESLADYLDALRDSVRRTGTIEQEAAKARLLSVKMHSIYGWCGNTLIVESLGHITEGTFPSAPEIGARLGNSPTPWNLTVHIWQPNTTAKPFPANPAIAPNTLVEPPHSHPFDFLSTVVKGEMYQSIYEQRGQDALPVASGYYTNVELEHVDGVWPPHDYRAPCYLDTREHRVCLKQGDVYYMPSDWIHDVELDGNLAPTKPTITLFLSSEYLVMPHAYMTHEMADFHKANPDIKTAAKPISEDAWHAKLKAISRYLRGQSNTLSLNDIVDHEGEYAFFHMRDS